MNDLEFVRRCVSGDRQTWDDFVEKYSRLIYNYIHNVLSNRGYSTQPETVNDLYQEIFTALIKDNFKKLRQYKAKNGASLASWLRIITINFTLDFLRKQKPAVSLDDDYKEEALSLKDRIADNRASSADEILLVKERLDILLDCIDKLNNQDKYLLEMHIYRGLNLETLKEMFKVSRSAIDMRKSRLIQRLRECFKQKGFALEL